jgi:4a-hydroxytetrahydrobiopterin dehydratase
MSELAARECVPCKGGVPPLKGEEISSLLSQLNGWNVTNEHHLEKRYKFSNFAEVQNLVAKIGDLAESQGHHPDICFGWGYCDVKIWTHKIDGLTESDFILAAKIDQLDS